MSERNGKAALKGEEIVHQTSYRKHRERLANIKQNLTGKDFFLDAHPRPSDRKGKMITQLKQQQIKHQNELLHNKIKNIQSRSQQEVEPPFVIKTEVIRNNLVRYEQEEGKININQDLNDGEPVKCIIPTKTRANSFNQASKLPVRPEVKSFFSSKPQKTYKSRPQHQSFYRSNKSERSQSQALQEELLFNLPQRNEMRSVLCHKTMLLSSSISCLYELSLIGDRLLIAAYIMGKEKYCITELIPLKKSKLFLKEYENNFDAFLEKISLQESKGKYYAIKLNIEKTEGDQKQEKRGQQQYKVKRQMQNDFIRRNYYETLKKQENTSEGAKSKPTIPQEKLDQLVHRLAAPKRYLLKDHVYVPPLPTQVPKPKPHSKASIPVEKRNLVEGSKEYGTQKRIKKDHFLEQTPKSHEEVKFQKTDSLTIEQPGKQEEISSKAKPDILHSEIIKQQNSPQKQEEQEVDYLQGDDYQEEFENPSSLNQSHPPKDPFQNSSKLSRGKLKEQSEKEKNEGEVLPQNEYENEEYQEIFEVSSPKAKQADVNKKSSAVVSLPEEKVEEEYADDQFQT